MPDLERLPAVQTCGCNVTMATHTGDALPSALSIQFRLDEDTWTFGFLIPLDQVQGFIEEIQAAMKQRPGNG